MYKHLIISETAVWIPAKLFFEEPEKRFEEKNLKKK